jgi:hypothetical protein
VRGCETPGCGRRADVELLIEAEQRYRLALCRYCHLGMRLARLPGHRIIDIAVMSGRSIYGST